MTVTATAPRAYSYTRWSTPEQGAGDSLKRQTEAAERYAAAKGLQLDGSSFLDAGVSAFKGANARGGALAAFITAAEAGKVPRGSVLIVESLDRLSRQPPTVALRQLQRILEAGVDVVADGKRYTAASLDTDIGDLLMAIVIAFRAHEESRKKAERVGHAWKTKRERAAADGVPITRVCPYWLRLEGGRFVPVPERVKVVRRVFQLAADGLGKDSIATRLNREGVPAIGKAGSWYPSYVQKILTNRAVIGEYQPHRLVDKRRVPDGDAIAGYFPAAVPTALFLKVNAQRSARRTPTGPRSDGVPNLFTGLLKCACGASVHFVAKDRTADGSLRRYLVCADVRRGVGDCGAKARPYAATESVLITLVADRVPWDQLAPRAKSAMETALASQEERAARLAVERAAVADRTAKVVAAIEEAPASGALTKRLAELEAKAAALAEEAERIDSLLDATRAGLATVDATARRQREALANWYRRGSTDGPTRARLATALRELLSRIVLPANPNAVSLHFADGRVEHADIRKLLKAATGQ